MNYKLAVSAWLGSQKLTEQEKAQRLRALRPSLDALRNSYKANSVQVSYEGSTAEAYLLGYVPPYIHQAQAVLRCALPAADLSGRDELRVGLLFPGPGPELIALVRELMGLKVTPRLRVTYFDIANQGWAAARHGLLRCADAIYPSVPSDETLISEETIDIDLRSPLDPRETARFRAFDILIAQNMANEIADSQQALNNVVMALTSAKAGALVVLSDQREYKFPAGRLEQSVTRRLAPHFDVVHDAMPSTGQDPLCKPFPEPNFPLLDKNFFSNGPGMKLGARKRMNVMEWIGVKRPERRT